MKGVDDHKSHPNELFRGALTSVKRKLQNNQYAHVKQFIADLETIINALMAIGADTLAKRYVKRILWQAQIFGFRTTTLDIRQNSGVTTAVLEEIWTHINGECPEYGSAEWSERLISELAMSDLPKVDIGKLSEASQELIALFALMHEIKSGSDPQAVGPFILSMTRSTDDLLCVYLLARYAGFGAETLDISVVPLFETIEDLQNASEILSKLLKVPLARRSLG